MLSLNDKIYFLENFLSQPIKNYADSFKENISIFIDDFNIENKLLDFLHNLESTEEIKNWVDVLCSRIVLKFDPEDEQINHFIYDYIKFSN